MEYYNSLAYAEHYYVEFRDIKDGLWHVSIGSPGYEGEPIELQGSDDPLEWEGDDLEDQTQCLFGTTGTLRVVATEETSQEFALGNLYPTELNDRRVVVTNDNEVVWQGFIEVNTYDQPYDSTPFEQELSLRSWINVIQDMPLPPLCPSSTKEDTEMWDDAEGVTCVAEFLRFMVKWTGCSYDKLYSNVAEYLDNDGNTQATSNAGETAHWTQGVFSLAGFYSQSEGRIECKTFGEVMECLLSPNGHMRELGDNLCIMVERLDVETRYMLDLGSGSTDVRMSASGTFTTINFSAIEVADDNTKTSNILAPSRINYERNLDVSTTVMSVEEGMVKNTASNRGKDLVLLKNDAQTEGETYAILYATYDASEVNMDAFKSYKAGLTFIKMIKVAYSGDGRTTTLLGLGIVLPPKTETRFGLKMPFRTWGGFNFIKLDTTVYCNGVEGSAEYVKMYVYDRTNGMYLYTNKDGVTGWYDSFDVKNDWDNANLLTYFDLNDSNGAHRLEFCFYNSAENVNLQLAFKVRYIPACDEVFDTEYFNQKNYMANSILDNKTIVEGKGGGDEVDATFKTLCGMKYSGATGSASVPYNSVCDQIGLLSTDNRTKITYENCYVYNNHSYADLLRNFHIVKKTAGLIKSTYAYGAVGMNARNATLKMAIVSLKKTIG